MRKRKKVVSSMGRWDNIWKRRIRYEESIYVVVIKKTVTLRVKHR